MTRHQDPQRERDAPPGRTVLDNPHQGMKAPSKPAAMISATGGTRVAHSSTMVAAMIAGPFQPPGLWLTSKKQLAPIKPSATGDKPRCMAWMSREN